MKEINKKFGIYWEDDDGNRWNREFFTKIQAIAKSKKLKKCNEVKNGYYNFNCPKSCQDCEFNTNHAK